MPNPAPTKRDALKALAEEVDQLAGRVGCLAVKRIDPEAFHAEKSDLQRQLRRLAGRLRAGVHPKPSTTWRRPE
jgi:hypothetical protein